MKIDWKAIRKRLADENAEVAKRRHERVDELIESAKERAVKDRDGNPILSYGSRAHRRNGVGQPEWLEDRADEFIVVFTRDESKL